MPACIYCIKNNINGHCYIGQTINYAQRKSKHLSSLRLNNHCNKHLQNAYNKYGEQNFSFSIIEEINDYSIIGEREAYWIDKLGYYNIDDGRNGFTPIALRNIKESHQNNPNINRDKRKLSDQYAMYIMAIGDFFDGVVRPLGRCLNISREIPQGIIKQETYLDVRETYSKLSFSEKLQMLKEGLKEFNFDVWKISSNSPCPLKTRYIRFLVQKTKLSYSIIGQNIHMSKDGVGQIIRNMDREVNTTFSDEQVKQILLVLLENNTVLSSALEKV